MMRSCYGRRSHVRGGDPARRFATSSPIIGTDAPGALTGGARVRRAIVFAALALFFARTVLAERSHSADATSAATPDAARIQIQRRQTISLRDGGSLNATLYT